MPTFAAMALLSQKPAWSLALLISILPPILSGTASDRPSTVYRTQTSEVRLSFYVTDESDHPVPGVTSNDFAVVDSGIVVRKFRSFGPSTETRFDIVALVDASESVQNSFPRTLAGVRNLLTDPAAGPDVTFSVLAFSGIGSEVLCWGNCARGSAEQKLSMMRAAGSTPLYDAFLDVTQRLSPVPAPDVRQIVVIFSDGRDTVSRASATDAMNALLSSHAVVYGVSLASAKSDSRSILRLREMAEATGGRLFSLDDSRILQTILAEQRAAYVVTYELPTRQPGFHSLRLLPQHNLKLRFHGRTGYYYDDLR